MDDEDIFIGKGVYVVEKVETLFYYEVSVVDWGDK
jgi:hypothetical protein